MVYSQNGKQFKSHENERFHTMWGEISLGPEVFAGIGLSVVMMADLPRRGLTTAPRFGWRLRLPQMWVTSVRNFWKWGIAFAHPLITIALSVWTTMRCNLHVPTNPALGWFICCFRAMSRNWRFMQLLDTPFYKLLNLSQFDKWG